MTALFTDCYIIKKAENEVSAVIVVCDGNGKLLIKHSVGNKTTLETEGYAILAALKLSISKDIKRPQIRSNSRYWVKAISFNWNIKNKKLILIKNKIIQLSEEKKAEIIWCPREQNVSGNYIDRVLKNNRNATIDS